MNEENVHHEKKNEHEKKDVTIVVNGRPKHWAEKEISYEQVVKLCIRKPTTRIRCDLHRVVPQGGRQEKGGYDARR